MSVRDDAHDLITALNALLHADGAAAHEVLGYDLALLEGELLHVRRVGDRTRLAVRVRAGELEATDDRGEPLITVTVARDAWRTLVETPEVALAGEADLALAAVPARLAG